MVKVIGMALTVSVVLFLLLNWGGRRFVQKQYLSDDALERYSDSYTQEFNELIESQHLIPDAMGIAAIKQWNKSKKNLFLLVYSDTYEEGNPDDYGLFYATSYDTIYGMELIDQLYSSYQFEFHYADGSIGHYFVYILSSYAMHLYGISTGISLAVSVVVFLIITIRYYLSVVGKINRFRHVLQQKQAGDTETSLIMEGDDELNEISESVQSMSDTLLESQKKEAVALQQYMDLQHRLAHDIRTPLTVLTGNLQLLQQHQYDDEAQAYQYIENCMERTTQITALLEELFGGSNPIRREKEERGVTLGIVFENMLMELGNVGYELDCKFDDCVMESVILMKEKELKRIFDNLFSNIRRYADRAYPITIMVDPMDDSAGKRKLTIAMENHMLENPDRSESHGLGQQICKEFLENAGGTFETFLETDHVYGVRMELPMQMD